jgi:pSer/pThr/pTyr-binding forkhead associated (FHA) protein
MPRLIMRRGPTPGTAFDLNTDLVSIGRGSKNDIIIRDNEVSREHCRLRRLQDEYEVEDVSSSNGTFVNGQRVQGSVLLQAGSLIELGDTITLEYEQAPRRSTGVLGALDEMDTHHRREPEIQHSLTVTMGPEMGHVFRLDTLIVTAGRDLSNDVVIQDPEVSRFHMRLRRGKHGYTVEDMGSTNGTYVNGVQVTQPRLLQSDDVIRLARQVRLQYAARHEEAAQSVEEETMIVESARDLRPRSAKMEQVFGQTSPLSPTIGSTGTLGQTGALRHLATGSLLRRTGKLPPAAQPGASPLSDTLFIAYARPDWERVVSSMVTSLQQAGVQSWVDQYLVQQGDDWRSALEQALSECWAIVVVVSAQSLSSNYVKMAYRYFATQQKPLISFIVEPETTLPPDLTQARAILFDRENPQRSYHKLILEVMHLRR